MEFGPPGLNGGRCGPGPIDRKYWLGDLGRSPNMPCDGASSVVSIAVSDGWCIVGTYMKESHDG